VRKEDVCGLDIPVDQAAIVGRQEAGGHAEHDVHRPSDGKRPALVEQGREILSLQKLHDHEWLSGLDAEIENLDHVAVAKLPDHLCLALEASDNFLLFGC